MRVTLRIASLLTMASALLGFALLESPAVMSGVAVGRLTLLFAGWVIWIADIALGMVVSVRERQRGWLIALMGSVALFACAPVIAIFAFQLAMNCGQTSACLTGPTYIFWSTFSQYLTVFIPFLTGVLTLILSYQLRQTVLAPQGAE